MISAKTTAFMLKNNCLELLEGRNKQEKKNGCFYKIIHFSMQFSAVEIRFIVTT